MADQPLQIVKTVSALPTPLAPNVIYLVRVGQGFDLYATDTTGSNAYKINVSSSQLADSIPVANNDTGATTLDNSVLLPRKIGEKWYKSGLRYACEYPYPYSTSSGSNTSGTQVFIPFTALEDATITALEVYSFNSKENPTISLGIYASDSNNDVAEPLFTSNPMACSAEGAKNAPCNVQITKGKVYWLSSLSIGSPVFRGISLQSMFQIKGGASANYLPIIGYYTLGNTSMAQSAPTNKLNLNSAAPRVVFVVA